MNTMDNSKMWGIDRGVWALLIIGGVIMWATLLNSLPWNMFGAIAFLIIPFGIFWALYIVMNPIFHPEQYELKRDGQDNTTKPRY